MTPLTVLEARAILRADEALEATFEARVAAGLTFDLEEGDAWRKLVADARTRVTAYDGKPVRPVPGSIYEVARPFITRAGKSYELGMQLELWEETDQQPFGFESRISTWVVKCPYFSPPDPQAIWSSIWMLIEQGYLKQVGTARYERLL